MAELEVWTVLRTAPPPAIPMMLGRLEVQSMRSIPAGVALFTSRKKAEVALEHTLAGIVPPAAFAVTRIGGEGGLSPCHYLGITAATFANNAVAAGLSPAKVSLMMGAVLGAYVDPTVEDANKPPTYRSLFHLFEAWFPKEVHLVKPTNSEFYVHNGYTTLIEKIGDAWLVYAKKGQFANVDEFKQHTAKMGEAFYGVFEKVEKAKEEAKLWIDGTQLLAQA